MAEENLSKEYIKFLETDTDRSNFIVNYLEKRGVKTTVINIGGKKHIYLNFLNEQYNGYFRLKTLIAHYDRVPGTPGANDNSFAVFTMMNWAVNLNVRPIQHNVRIIFTDGEETCSSESEGAFSESVFSVNNLSSAKKSVIQSQGAYQLGLSLRKNMHTGEDFYVFDCMGRGTVPVLAKAPLLKKAASDFRKNFSSLYHRAETVLQIAAPSSWVSLPVSWSDNAGLTAAGLPSVLITMLPKEEAGFYMMNLAKNPELENFVINHEVTSTDTKCSLNALLPKTWLFLHSDYDDAGSITVESTEVFEKILDAIAAQKVPAL